MPNDRAMIKHPKSITTSAHFCPTDCPHFSLCQQKLGMQLPANQEAALVKMIRDAYTEQEESIFEDVCIMISNEPLYLDWVA